MYTTAVIAKLLKTRGKALYVYPGGTITPIFHECKAAGVPLICGKTEQGAGYMAIADAALSGEPAFVAVTSGPGATNLITCIADAWFDSYPLVCLTGQVGVRDLERAPSLRQRGFQETPILDMVRAVTKEVFQPRSGEQLLETLPAAWLKAQDGRPGPVLIDLPMSAQLEALDPALLDAFTVPEPPAPLAEEPTAAEWEQVSAALAGAARPLLLLGAGALRAAPQLRKWAPMLGLPVVSSLRGLGILSTTDSLWQGWIGHTGLPWANWALENADVVLVLGSRLDLRQTGTQTDRFDRKILIHVDIDAEELNHCRVMQELTLRTSIESFVLTALGTDWSGLPDWSSWWGEVARKQKELPLGDHGTDPGVAPDALLRLVDDLTGHCERAVVTGVGSHQQWAARYFAVDYPRQLLLTSAGHGAMGFALPAALGVKRLQPQRLVIVADGDGSFQMNLQELALVQELGLAVKILVLDNQRLGNVSQFQQLIFHDDPVTGNFHSPDFVAVARAYGLAAWHLERLDEAVIRSWLDHPGAALLHVHIQHDAPVSPLLLAGQNLDQMWYR